MKVKMKCYSSELCSINMRRNTIEIKKIMEDSNLLINDNQNPDYTVIAAERRANRRYKIYKKAVILK